jgi:hypothetical protein
MDGVNAPDAREVRGVEGQHLLHSVGQQQGGQPGIVRTLAGNLAAVDQLEPAVHGVCGLGEERELLAKPNDGFRGCGNGPPQAIHCFGPSRHGPKLRQDLSADEQQLVTGQQTLECGVCNAMLAAVLVGQSHENARVEQPAH